GAENCLLDSSDRPLALAGLASLNCGAWLGALAPAMIALRINLEFQLALSAKNCFFEIYGDGNRSILPPRRPGTTSATKGAAAHKLAKDITEVKFKPLAAKALKAFEPASSTERPAGILGSGRMSKP